MSILDRLNSKAGEGHVAREPEVGNAECNFKLNLIFSHQIE